MSKFWPIGHAAAQDSWEGGSRYCRFNVVSKGWACIVRGPWDSANDNSALNLSAAQGCKVWIDYMGEGQIAISSCELRGIEGYHQQWV